LDEINLISRKRTRSTRHGETQQTEKYATLQNQFKMHAAKLRTKLVAFDNKIWAKISLVTIIFLLKQLSSQSSAMPLMGVATERLRHM